MHGINRVGGVFMIVPVCAAELDLMGPSHVPQVTRVDQTADGPKMTSSNA